MTSYRKWLDRFLQEFVDLRPYIKSDSKLCFKLKMKRFQTMSMRAKQHPIESKKTPNWVPMPSWQFHPGIDCDVTLRTDTPNGRQFQVHQAVLCKASNYFQALYSGCWNKASGDAITVPGITDEKLEIILGRWSKLTALCSSRLFNEFSEYVYTGNVRICVENVQELFLAADQFNIEGIVSECCKFLKENLQPENCIGVRNVSSVILWVE